MKTHTAARAIIDYVVKDWPWAEPPPENVMAGLRGLDAAYPNGLERWFIADLDFAYDHPLQDWMKLLAPHGARIERFEPEGPAGGNPRVWLSFPSRHAAAAFLQKYLAAPIDRSLYPITRGVPFDART